MGNYLYGYIEEEDESLSIEIDLPKSCYYPGEKLIGNIILQAKSNKVPSIFNFSETNIALIQHQKYQCYKESILINNEDSKILFEKTNKFRKYKNRDILSPLKIPFSIRIPLETYPTLIHKNMDFIRHYLKIEFIKIKKQKAVGIIIQNRQRFTADNKLFKSPVEKFKDSLKSSFLQKTSRLAFLLKTDKNSYAYNELIPYEIILNYSELDIPIQNIRMGLARSVHSAYQNFMDVKPIIIQDYNPPEKTEDSNGVFQINGYFSFPLISDYFSVNPMNIYNFYNNKIIDNIDKTFKSMYLYPSCETEFLSCEYSLSLEINFNSTLIKNEYLYLPIELYTPLQIIDDNEGEEENEEEEINDVKETEDKKNDKPNINNKQNMHGSGAITLFKLYNYFLFILFFLYFFKLLN